MSKPKKSPITLELALGIVKSAPGALGQDAIAEHVRKALQSVYDDGRRDGALEARETVQRERLAFFEGLEARSRGSANEARNDLNATLEALGKDRVWAPERKS